MSNVVMRQHNVWCVCVYTHKTLCLSAVASQLYALGAFTLVPIVPYWHNTRDKRRCRSLKLPTAAVENNRPCSVGKIYRLKHKIHLHFI